MDFDEYDYLEMTVENPVAAKDNNEGGEKLENGEEKERYSKRKSDEDAYKQDYKTKKPRHDDEKREQEEDDRGDRDRRGRGGGHRSPQYQRDRGRANGRDRERYKSNRVDDRDRDRGRRDNRGRDRSERDYRDKERGRDRGTKDVDRLDKERVPDKEKERERYRDRDREREKRSKEPERKPEREKDQEKIKEKEMPGDKDVPREKERDKEYSRPKREKKEDAGLTEPEADPERDQRTVFAWQISLKADERDVYEFFSQAGKVRDVRLIMDRNSRRSKGVGYVEFYDAMSVPVAIAMTGQVLLGQPVMVKPSEAEKNLAHSAANALANNAGYNGPLSGGARRLYVGNLHFHMTEDQLRQVFEPFGVIELVQLPLDADTGLCKGFGFVQYQRLEDARSAQQALNGVLELAGRPIKVSAVTDQFGMQEPGATQGDLDDDEGGGLALNARSRALLMQKLDRSGAAPGVLGATNTNPIAAQTLGMLNAGPGVSSSVTPLVANPLLAQGLPGMGLAGLQNAALIPPMTDSIGVPSSCLLLKNMFDPKTETEPDFDLDIKDDVQEECLKFGLIKHIFVDKNSEGHVYLRFDSAIAATKAQQALHGRWFAGKMITATFMTISAYEEKFPESG